MFIVGVTGGIGSGKTAVTNILQSLGITVVDADIVAREVVEPGEPALEKIADHFGQGIITAEGTLDRAALRAKIFDQQSERVWLEQLLHPLIREQMMNQLASAKGSYAVLSSPLLLETDQKSLTDHIVVVDVPVELQISRTRKRDNNSETQVQAIIAAQISREDRVKQADSLISNELDLEHLQQQVVQLHDRLQALAQQASQ
ncbi:MAG: dephospho-CoA kinase [Neptuniibacter caesariensis]|uniref:Dephospho-CoA kinase n=1 Tax=Neptuniibacter caesariensis TaxID=207954 RepID=A0A2G6JJN4_NEPCE|nr:MAG: dephospho-CoA kinase [Neptuniibacter caesariensis]